MNSSTRQTTNIILDSLIITLSSASICISVGILGLILCHLIKTRNSPNQVALLLTANVYLALVFTGLLVLAQFVHVFLGHLYSLMSLNDGIGCQIQAYLTMVSVCAILYSNSLQAIYRLCRVVFCTKRSLQSLQLYKLLIIIQWIISCLLMLPSLLLGDFQYAEEYYVCQGKFTNFRTVFMSGTLTYLIPMFITTGCYILTLRKLQDKNNTSIQTMTQIQQISARRDLIVLFRICILLGVLMLFYTPSMIVLLIYLFTEDIPWWASQSQWLVLSLSITSITVILTLISPHVWNLWTRHHYLHRHTARIFPIVRVNQILTK